MKLQFCFRREKIEKKKIILDYNGPSKLFECCSFSNSVNSFQIVVSADESTSLVIYNYEQLSWYQYNESFAVYNAGDGVGYSILPGSLSGDILKILI